VGNKLTLHAIPSLFGALLGLSFSVITGIFSGYYPPPLKAAGLSSLEALNYEQVINLDGGKQERFRQSYQLYLVGYYESCIESGKIFKGY